MAAAVSADDCPCVPISRTWLVTACETWNCAQAALVLANGDPFVMSMPTSDTKYGWVVLRRVATGTAAALPESPFVIDSHPTVGAAMAQFDTLDQQTLPMIVSAADGTTLVVRLREAAPASRRRAAH
jgi:hypothetical protein